MCIHISLEFIFGVLSLLFSLWILYMNNIYDIFLKDLTPVSFSDILFCGTILDWFVLFSLEPKFEHFLLILLTWDYSIPYARKSHSQNSEARA